VGNHKPVKNQICHNKKDNSINQWKQKNNKRITPNREYSKAFKVLAFSFKKPKQNASWQEYRKLPKKMYKISMNKNRSDKCQWI
jgi:hypothetical protein